MPLLDQIDREPGEEKIGQRGDAVLPHINAEQHAVAQQLADVRPTRPHRWRPTGSGAARAGQVQVHQRPALPDVRQLPGADARMRARAVDQRKPQGSHQYPERAHAIEHAGPAVGVRQPAHQRREHDGGEILGGVENGRRRAALHRREPGRDDPRIGRKRRRLSHPDQQAQRKQHGNGRAGGGRPQRQCALQQRKQRPRQNAQPVHPARTKAVEQPAARQLRQHVRPAKGRKQIAHGDGVQTEVLGQRRPCQ